VVSHDRDFESLALLHPGGKVILLTGGNLSTTETERLLRLFFEQIEAFGLDSSQQVLELR
jgi:predicted nuclease of predicted toxin-antitoxin system